MTHDDTATETAHHKEAQGNGQYDGSRTVVHPPLPRDVVDEVAVDRDLSHLVSQQGNQSEDEELMLPHLAQRLTTIFRSLIEPVVMFDLGEVDPREDGGDDEYHDAKDDIRRGHTGILVAEEELPHSECGKEATHAVERLRQVQTTRGRLARSQLCDIRIGCRLEEHESDADDEQREEKGTEGAGLGTGHEEQRADAEEQQSEDHAPAVAEAIDEEACRNGHQEVAEIGGHLDHRRLGDGDVHLVLEVLVEHIENGSGEAPEEE